MEAKLLQFPFVVDARRLLVEFGKFCIIEICIRAGEERRGSERQVYS